MAKTNFGYVGAAGLEAFHNSLQALIADRVANQELAKKEALAREATWQKNLEAQRDYMQRGEQLGISKGQLTLAQAREARDAAEAAKPKVRYITGLKRPGGGSMTAGVPEGTTGEWEDYLPPEKPNTTPVKGVNIGGKPFTVFYDESGKQVGDPVAEYNEPRAAGTTRPPTGAQNRALNFYNRMQDALGTIEATESQLNDKDRALIGNIPANGWLESGAFLLLSDAGKSYSRAMKQFTEARLRKDSGAAVPANEYVSDLRTYGARVGDTPASAAERLRGRRETAESVAFEAGPAFEAFYGEPFRRGMLTPSTAPAEAQTGRSAAPPRRLTQGADGAIREGRPAAAPAPPVKKKTRLTVGPNGQLVEVEVK